MARDGGENACAGERELGRGFKPVCHREARAARRGRRGDALDAIQLDCFVAAQGAASRNDRFEDNTP
jgi:hypothetical protein